MAPKANRFSRLLRAGALDTLDKLREAAAVQRNALDYQTDSFCRFNEQYSALDDGPDRAIERLAFPSLFTDEQSLRFHSKSNWLNVRPRFRYGVASFIEAARVREVPLFAFRAFDQEHVAHAAGNCVLIHHRLFGLALSPGEHLALRILLERVSHNKGIPMTYNRGLITDPFGSPYGPFLPGQSHMTPRAILRARG